MIYLQGEIAVFEKTKKVFEKEYTTLLEQMFDTFKEKGKTRDVGSPLHHRQSPIGMLSTAQAKCRRIETLLSFDRWELDEKHLADVVEECIDASNYLLYIAALCRMLEKEI